MTALEFGRNCDRIIMWVPLPAPALAEFRRRGWLRPTPGIVPALSLRAKRLYVRLFHREEAA